jgi:hypothetical protein
VLELLTSNKISLVHRQVEATLHPARTGYTHVVNLGESNGHQM